MKKFLLGAKAEDENLPNFQFKRRENSLNNF